MPIGGDAPIPGENYTSDTKNYPWHQPPEFTDLDDALDFLAKRITKFQAANGILTAVELGIPIVNITDMIVTSGIGEGKWTPDFALMIAGPLTKMIEVMCVGFDVEYDVGIDDDESFVTGSFFKHSNTLRDESYAGAFKVLSEKMDEIKEDVAQNEATGESTKGLGEQGFMAMQGASNASSGGGGIMPPTQPDEGANPDEPLPEETA